MEWRMYNKRVRYQIRFFPIIHQGFGKWRDAQLIGVGERPIVHMRDLGIDEFSVFVYFFSLFIVAALVNLRIHKNSAMF